MKIVEVKNLRIGEGMPKICVSIIGKNRESILKQAKDLSRLELDLVEWRVDCFEQASSQAAVLELLSELTLILEEKPLIFTFRTEEEGGEQRINPNDYIALNKAAAASGHADFIDVQLFMGELLTGELIEWAHEHRCLVICSNHDFMKTPSAEDMVSRLCKMQALGADLPKLAVMPSGPEDVLRLLEATVKMNAVGGKTPIITMSMGGQGVVTRFTGELFGSALTFAAGDAPSAPGQISLGEMRHILKSISGAI